MPRKSIVLEHGLNYVVYKDSKEEIPEDRMLYYNDKAIGSLKEIKNIVRGWGTDKVFVNYPVLLGTVEELKDELQIDDQNKVGRGGNRKSKKRSTQKPKRRNRRTRSKK